MSWNCLVVIDENAIFYHKLWFGGRCTTIGGFVPSKMIFGATVHPADFTSEALVRWEESIEI